MQLNPSFDDAGTQVVMHDLLSGQAREIVRTVWDGKQPTALAFLYANSARLLGFVAGDNSNEIILGPVLAVGSAAGTVTLLNLSSLQVLLRPAPTASGHGVQNTTAAQRCWIPNKSSCTAEHQQWITPSDPHETCLLVLTGCSYPWCNIAMRFRATKVVLASASLTTSNWDPLAECRCMPS